MAFPASLFGQPGQGSLFVSFTNRTKLRADEIFRVIWREQDQDQDTMAEPNEGKTEWPELQGKVNYLEKENRLSDIIVYYRQKMGKLISRSSLNYKITKMCIPTPFYNPSIFVPAFLFPPPPGRPLG